MSGWIWTKFWWGMLLVPVLVIIATLIEGRSVTFGVPLIAFVIAWMAVVLVLMRKLGVPPFGKGDG
ncbi:MAG: hypothetical protein ACLGIB_12450 [Actinomycetota bacterium]